MKKILIFLAGLLLFSTVWAGDPDQEAPESHDNEAVDISPAYKIIPQTRAEEDPASYSAFDINYPQISGGELSSAAQHFNSLVKQIVDEEVGSFKDSVKRDLPHIKTLPESVRHNNFHLDYDIDVIHPGQHAVISVRFSIEAMQAGRAHPSHRHRSLNFDFGQNKVLKLGDLFKPHVNYLRAVAAYSVKKLNEPLIVNRDKMPKETLAMRQEMIKEGTQPTENNFKNWNIESDAILITFDEYQVAPYVEGAVEAEIPYSALKTVLSNDTSLAPCIKKPGHCVEKRHDIKGIVIR